MNEIDKRRELPLEYKGEHALIGMSPINIRKKNTDNFKKIIFPLPNFTALYLSISDKHFDIACKLNDEIIDLAVDKLDYYELNNEDEAKLYDFFEALFTSIIFAFAAIECLINNLIPNYVIILKKKSQKDLQVQSKNFIEKYLTLEEKIKKILPKVYEYGFNAKGLKWWNQFKKLVKYRNDLLHFKSNEVEGNKLSQAKFIGELWVDVNKFDIVESAREIIKYLVKKVQNAPGFPSEFSKDNITTDKFFKHYIPKKFDLNKKLIIKFSNEEAFNEFIENNGLEKERVFEIIIE